MKKLLTAFFVLCMFLTFIPFVLGAAKRQNISAKAILKNPKEIVPGRIEFQIGKSRGLQLKDQEFFELVIPKKYLHRKPDYAYIKHRKEYVFFTKNDKGIDPNNAWLQISFHNPKKQQWIIWADQFGSLKRSAARLPDEPKKNSLYNFCENVGNFTPDRVRITNFAEGDRNLAISSVHTFGLVYLTDKATEASKTRIFADYFQPNNLAIRYVLDFEHGLELQANHTFLFKIPENFKDNPIFHIILKHRKAFSMAHNPLEPEAFDPNAAYMLCEAHNPTTGYWHKWVDRSSFAKFSEVRTHNNPEAETLHNCLRTFGNFAPDMIRVTNVGSGIATKSTARIHELEIVFYPDIANSEILEQFFTPETSFSRPDQGKPVPLLGGGPRLSGKFPGALLLGPAPEIRRSAINNLPEEHRFAVAANQGENYEVNNKGELLINLPANRLLKSVELAIGDLDITSLSHNKDGYFGRSGNAQASIFLLGNNEYPLPLITNNNIGMAGLITCGGPVNDIITDDNFKLKIVIENDNAFLMGFRILLQSPTK